MKKMIAILLAGLIVALPTHAQPPKTEPQPKSLFGAVVLLACVAAAGAVVIYVYTTSDTYAGNRTLVLDRAPLDTYGVYTESDWQPVKTNTIYVRTKKTELFRDVLRDPGYIYRVRVLPNP